MFKGVLFQNGGLKAAQLELFVNEFIEELKQPSIIQLIGQLENFNLAA